MATGFTLFGDFVYSPFLLPLFSMGQGHYCPEMCICPLPPLCIPRPLTFSDSVSFQIAIITRSREKAIDIWVPQATKHPWYLLETNYDHWKSPLFIDDRRTPANKCMQQKGQKVIVFVFCFFSFRNLTFSSLQAMGFPAIFDMLSSRPMLNKVGITFRSCPFKSHRKALIVLSKMMKSVVSEFIDYARVV